MGLKEELEGKIPKGKLGFLRTGFDIVGDIAIIEIPEELESKKLVIAKALQKTHPHIRAVARKLGEREGTFRLRELEVLVGKSTETIHKECGCSYKMDVARVYFSPREATERQRISQQVKPKETVMVFFAGVGPYAIMIAKKQPRVGKVYGIEMNPEAVKYMKENVRINRVQEKVEPVLGDVKKVSRPFYGKCDRVVMPLPKEGYKFLGEAFACLKSTGAIHFYSYAHEENLFQEAEGIVKKAAKKAGRAFRVIQRRKVLPYGPRVFKVCLDIKAGKSK